MSDLQSQLISKCGATPSANTSPSKAPDPLSATSHLNSDWIAVLQDTVKGLSGVKLNAKPSLPAARQATQRALKILKKAGAKTKRRTLLDVSQRYFKKREKLAWSLVKDQFTSLKLSEKAYRSLKQSSADPERLLNAMARTPDERLQKMGAAALRDTLTKK